MNMREKREADGAICLRTYIEARRLGKVRVGGYAAFRARVWENIGSDVKFTRCPSCQGPLDISLVGLEDEIQICVGCGWESGDAQDDYALPIKERTE